MLAAGIKGIEEKCDPGSPLTGDAYENSNEEIPTTLKGATDALRGSKMLRDAMGDNVIDHYVRMAEWEQEAFEAVVTDWEIARGFERA
jgi:glutamine synthetase